MLSMANGGPWRRAKVLPYQPLKSTVIVDYDGKTHNISRNLPLRQAQKPLVYPP